MVLVPHKKLIFKGSKKKHQILAQTAYYQAGKIVVQTILPEQPPVALITLNTLGTTCSTSADTYIPIENISNTQSCSFFESRLISLYGGKAASLLIEYQQRLFQSITRNPYILEKVESIPPTFLKKEKNVFPQLLSSPPFQRTASDVNGNIGIEYTVNIFDVTGVKMSNAQLRKPSGVKLLTSSVTSKMLTSKPSGVKLVKEDVNVKAPSRALRSKMLEAGNKANKQEGDRDIKDIRAAGFAYPEGKHGTGLAKLGKSRLRETYFAGAGNNIFQSTLGNREIQIATHLARIMVNYCNFYSLNKLGKASKQKGDNSLVYPKGFNVNIKRVTTKMLKKMLMRWNDLHFAIAQSKNSLKICENKNSSYNIQRRSVENIINYSQRNNNFQLINSLQFSNLQRDRFYPNWFRLYLPDIEATEFLKNVANYYFSLGLQTLALPSTKSSYYFTTIRPCAYPERFPSQLLAGWDRSVRTDSAKGSVGGRNKVQSSNVVTPSEHTQGLAKLSYASPGGVCTDDNGVISSKLRTDGNILTSSMFDVKEDVKGNILTSLHLTHTPRGKVFRCTMLNQNLSTASPFLTFLNKKIRRKKYKLLSYTSPNIISSTYCSPLPLAKRGYQVGKALLLENQIFPLNYNGFSIVEKELLYDALVNSSFAKAFYLINQNRQLLDFFVDYLLRFRILRQHQILYLFSTLLVGCNKTRAT